MDEMDVVRLHFRGGIDAANLDVGRIDQPLDEMVGREALGQVDLLQIRQGAAAQQIVEIILQQFFAQLCPAILIGEQPQQHSME